MTNFEKILQISNQIETSKIWLHWKSPPQYQTPYHEYSETNFAKFYKKI